VKEADLPVRGPNQSENSADHAQKADLVAAVPKAGRLKAVQVVTEAIEDHAPAVDASTSRSISISKS